MSAPVVPVDRDFGHRTKLGLILRLLADAPQSRTDLATQLSLPRATVGGLVAELLADRLVSESGIDRTGLVGRPRRALRLSGHHLRGVGIEIAADHIHVITRDLSGAVLSSRSTPLDVRFSPQARVIGEISTTITDIVDGAAVEDATVLGVTIAAPGYVHPASGVVIWSPTIGWDTVPVIDELRAAIGRDSPPLRLANDAHLATIAEYQLARSAGIRNLVSISGGAGIGVGVIVGGRNLDTEAGRGAEFGHIPINPIAQQCRCGRQACWETMINLDALLRLAVDASDPARDPEVDLDQRLLELATRARNGDQRLLAALTHIGEGLGLGISTLADLFNPQRVILGGYYSVLADFLTPHIRNTLRRRAIASAPTDFEILPSTLGLTAAAHGGSYLAFDPVFDNPILARAARPPQ